MTQSLLIYTERQQRLCAHAATNIRHLHSHCKGTIQLLRIYTSMQCSKSIDFSIFWAIYMRRKYIHCKDTTQSLLIYTERQQRLCAHAATNIRHSHSYCESMTQLLHTYTSVRRNKSINFSIFWLIYMHRKYRDQNSSRLIASSRVIEVESSFQLVKTRFKSEFLTWVFESS